MFAKLEKAKKKLGFTTKTRTKEEIDKEYTHHSIMIGHNARVIDQLQEDSGRHLAKLKELNAEGMRAQAATINSKIAPPQTTTATEAKA